MCGTITAHPPPHGLLRILRAVASLDGLTISLMVLIYVVKGEMTWPLDNVNKEIRAPEILTL